MMAHRHGKGREKKEKKSPAKQRVGVEEAVHRLRNITAILVCNTCDRNDTCTNRIRCDGYKTSKEQFSEDFKELEQELDEDEEMKE